MNRRALGTRYEELALAQIRADGAYLVEKNFRCRSGEIDLILRDGRYLVFAEVKYRANARFGEAALAVGVKKQRTICRVCDFYRFCRKLPEDTPVRFDVIAIDAPSDEKTLTGSSDAGESVQIRWLKNAFPYQV